MNTTRIVRNKLNWTNILFFSILPVVAILGTIGLCLSTSVSWQSWTLAGIYMALTGLSITAGYHRLFSHKTYRAVQPLRFILLLFAAGAFQGSALEWCSDHRNHHRYTDTDKDPYNIKEGFWYAHMGWLFRLDSKGYNFSNVPDMLSDKSIMLQHKYYLAIAIFMGFLLPMGIASLWGEPLAGLLIAGALRMTLNHHFTFAINSFSHIFGKKPYSDEQTACDNWITALVTYGEGFHNFHHQFPLDYRNGIRAYDYDPTKWLIKTLSWFKLTYDLKQVSAHRIIRYHVQNQEKALKTKLANAPEAQLSVFQQKVNPILENIYNVLKRMETLEKEYRLALKANYDKRHNFKESYRTHLATYKAQFKSAQENLKEYMQDWRSVLTNYRRLGLDFD